MNQYVVRDLLSYRCLGYKKGHGQASMGLLTIFPYHKYMISPKLLKHFKLSHDVKGCPRNIRGSKKGRKWAARRGHIELYKYYSTRLNVSDYPANPIGEWDQNLFLKTCKRKHFDLARYMITCGLRQTYISWDNMYKIVSQTQESDLIDFMYLSYPQGRKIELAHVCQFDHLDQVKAIIKMRRSLRGKSLVKANWNLALENACYYGHLKIVKLLIAHNADDLKVGFFSACEGGHQDICEFLIHMMAQKNRTPNYNHAILLAGYKEHCHLIDYFEKIQKRAIKCSICQIKHSLMI